MREAQVQEGREGFWAEETAGAKAARGEADLAVRGGVGRSCVMGGAPSMAAVAAVEAGKQGQSPFAVILEPKKIVSLCFHCFPIYLP